jgi:hypothetical protein
MASTRRLYEFPIGGFDRSQASHRSEGTFYDLLQLRPQKGKLVQTDPMLLHLATSSQVRFNDLVRNANGDLRYLTLTEAGGLLIDPSTPYTQVAVPVVLQIAVPNQSTIIGECLLWGISTLDFAAANDQIDVQIASATTFQWRKNGGSWSSALTIGPEVSIGTALKVSFMDDDGYNTGDTWSWKRTSYPYTGADASTVRSVPKVSAYKSDVYIAGVERNILRLRSDVLTSVGYKRAYGKYCAIFQNHLVIAQYAPGVYHAVNGVSDSYDPATTPWNLGWSHLDNPDQLFSTDLNEADEYVVPTTGFPDTPVIGITGLAQRGQLLFIFLPDSISVMRYVGLPLVMQIDTFDDSVGSRFSNGLVAGEFGHYFIGSDDFYFFDGTSKPRSIGESVREKFFDELVPENDTKFDQLFGYYDRGRNEVSWTYWIDIGSEYQCRQVVYRERDQKWFFRNVPDIRCMGRLYRSRRKSTFGHSTGVLRDATVGTDSASSLIEDKIVDGGTDGFTQPVVETHVQRYGAPTKIKDVDGFYIDASYNTSSGVQLAVSQGAFVDNLAAFVNRGAPWLTTTVEEKIDYMLVGAKAAKFRLTFTGTKPLGCVLNAFGPLVAFFDAEK